MTDALCGVCAPSLSRPGEEEAVEVATPSTDEDTTNENEEDFVHSLAFGKGSGGAVSSFDRCELKDGQWICGPYKREVLQQQIDNNSPGSGRRAAIVETLRDMGIKVFIIDGAVVTSTREVIGHLKRVVNFVSRENLVVQKTGPLGFQRCLLYQDRQGRVFNLLLDSHAVGPVSQWQQYLDSFSGLEAMIALVVLARSFPCAVAGEQLEALRPAYLSLILGLVLTEEISLSWLNASMLVRAAPSVSAHTLTSRLGSDLLRKLVILILAASGAATGDTQRYATLVGIGLACIILLSNLGSRAWHFMGWKPLRYQGYGGPLLAYFASIATGIVFPYMGHRSIGLGGSPAMKYVVKTAFFLAAAFVISDLDVVQEFLIVGSERCKQDLVHIIVGGWWFFALVSSLFMVRAIPKKIDSLQYDTEPLLVEDHASPVGYKVPSIPDFVVNPSLAQQADGCLSAKSEFFIGLVMAFVVGGAIIYLSFTDWDETVAEKIEEAVGGL